ncbi:MAG TPA: EAL domain-containing protein [Acetobacteraceae bacterium]
MDRNGTQSARLSFFSIRTVLVSLGALSVLIAAMLAGLGLLGIGRQLDARQRVMVLEQASHNHTDADNFMDSVRTDVLRALLHSDGTNKEGSEVIRIELRHHIEKMNTGISENLALPLPLRLHDDYVAIAELAAKFAPAGEQAVELALSDTAAGSANFERFRREFSEIETMMDDLREVLHAAVMQVRNQAAKTATQAKQMIMASALVGIGLLVLVMTAAIRIVQGITADLARSREEAQRLALHDALTGLPNRALFAERLEQALAHVQRYGTKLAVLCLDLDRFKQVNDTYGHPVGDALLHAVAGRLRGCLRSTDTVARLGGDEFAIIQTPLERAADANVLAGRIVEALSEPYNLDPHQISIGASVGLALAPADTADATDILKMADMALYRAKADGRGLFRMFDSSMDALLQARRRLELDLRRAIEVQEFELHYQPLVDLASGRVNAMEALVRWRHPERGLVRPDDFIPLAEETGLIAEIGAWVLHRACKDAADWPADVHIAVNVSATQFQHPGLIAAVSDALAASALPPERLELEITETAFLADADATLAVLHELRAKGLRFAMDDFGTGYSSLSYLRSFPFDKIKIDRSFVRDIETSSDCRAIVRAVIGLGCNLEITTTAEGVETAAQVMQLRADGCKQAQGYLFSRPVPVSEVPNLLRRFPALVHTGQSANSPQRCLPELA